MFLAFSISDIITVPFGYLMDWLYQFTNNYGLALILFALLVQLVMLPIQTKSKKSMMKMSRLTPKIQDIQKRYADDQAKQNQMVQQLYKDEGVSMTGGCLWSFVPILILLPLYQVVRQPLVYMLHQNIDTVNTIIETMKNVDGSIFTANSFFDQIIAARYINLPEYAEAVRAALPEISDRVLQGINFGFLGLDLGAQPQFNIFGADWIWDWAHIGLFFIPVISAGSQVLQMWIGQKMNNSVITNEKGVQDKEAAKQSQSNQTSKVMMWVGPLMSLWIGFSYPAALSLYWFAGGIVRTVEDALMTSHFRKIYDAEDAERLAKAMEEDRIEAEKERQRAERRAANPEGITQNTSKKKLQKQQQQAEAAQKAAAAKEYAAKKGVEEETDEGKKPMSGIADRPYCKGRNYDPNRYSNTTEE